jgi:hypothetical protein
VCYPDLVFCKHCYLLQIERLRKAGSALLQRERENIEREVHKSTPGGYVPPTTSKIEEIPGSSVYYFWQIHCISFSRRCKLSNSIKMERKCRTYVRQSRVA